jgi:hypothetical protein
MRSNTGIRVTLIFKVVLENVNTAVGVSASQSSLSSILAPLSMDHQAAQLLMDQYITASNDNTTKSDIKNTRSNSNEHASSSQVSVSFGELLKASLSASEVTGRLSDFIASIVNSSPMIVTSSVTTPRKPKGRKRPISYRTGGKRSRDDGYAQLGIILTSARSALTGMLIGTDSIIINHLKKIFIDTGFASSIEIRQVLITWNGKVESGYAHERPSSTALVYSLSPSELEWARKRYLNQIKRVQVKKKKENGSDEDDEEYESKQGPSSSREMNIPFYHISDGQWPGGVRLSIDQSQKVHGRNSGDRKWSARSTSAIHLSTAAIVTWRPINEWLTSMLPRLHYNRSIATMIADYLTVTSFANWY